MLSRLRALVCLAVTALTAAEHHGRVTFNGLPVPGAIVVASQEGKKLAAVSDQEGVYAFPDLADGSWTVAVEMFGFARVQDEIAIAPNAPAKMWELTLLRLDEIKAEVVKADVSKADVAKAESRPAAAPSVQEAPATNQNPDEDDLRQRAADGFLINGSMNNGAASPFAQNAAFGNNRFGGRHLYNGGIGFIFDNSALDASPFSLTGQITPKAAYNRMTGVATFGGPIRIPHLFSNGPNVFVGYQWTRNNNATVATALVPDAAERNGILPNLIIPADRISPQARALLNYYPLPNFDGNGGYNYQIPILRPTHQDALQSRVNKTLSSRDQVYGGFAFQSIRSDDPNLFGFLDTVDTLGINANVNWSHRFRQRLFMNVGVQFSRLATHVTPFFDNRVNVSGEAGISGNNQEPANWGPPSLVFSSGIAGLSDSQSAFNRNQTTGTSFSMLWSKTAHNITFGGDFRRQEFNYRSQQDPRGTFTFTGAASGNDFADFLLGTPDTSAIAFGNADKYFRDSVYDVYFTDDWRVSPEVTLNIGARWEYGAPITELYGRLVNLDIASGFLAAMPVVAGDPRGALTGRSYPSSLVNPDKRGFEPRIGVAWRPFAGSSMVIRAGYGLYRDTSVYQTIALQMAQQPPLSTALSVQNSASNPLTLANGFIPDPAVTGNTFAIDPNFRIGYAQNWQLSVQRDLPGALVMTATYLGIKGTRGVQDFLPNTYPVGISNPCPACPIGFSYLTSNGNSIRESGQIQLRRRLHSGLTATLQYTFAKAIDDDAALGGQGAATGNLAIAQNWLDLRAERGLSSFDQRHLLSTQLQYTTGMGLTGGTLWNGWRGAIAKDWTFSTQITAGSGLPQTPIYLQAVEGTGVTGTLRPDYTGAPLYEAPAGRFLNAGAYTIPSPGAWGNAGRNSITGPAQFTLNASLGRTFRLSDRLNLDLRVDSTNALNHVVYTSWNTIVNNTQFGLPAAANAMRSVQTTLRVRF